MTYKKLLILFLSSFIFSLTVSARTATYTKQDSILVETYFQEFKNKKHLPISELTIETAKYFLGKPYVAATLEINKDEQLVVNLREFDCTTFVETCFALTQTLRSTEPSFRNYCTNLTKIRYRGGKIEDYSSRLHYISDWAHEHRQTFDNMGSKLGGYLETKEINYMSTHSNLYTSLKNNQTFIKKIKIVEDALNKRAGHYVIVKEDVSKVGKQFKNGDIVVFATSIPGLDFTHIGFVYYENGILKFIHVSSAEKKVVIEKRTLKDYCNQSKKCVGVMVLRQKID